MALSNQTVGEQAIERFLSERSLAVNLSSQERDALREYIEGTSAAIPEIGRSMNGYAFQALNALEDLEKECDRSVFLRALGVFVRLTGNPMMRVRAVDMWMGTYLGPIGFQRLQQGEDGWRPERANRMRIAWEYLGETGLPVWLKDQLNDLNSDSYAREWINVAQVLADLEQVRPGSAAAVQKRLPQAVIHMAAGDAAGAKREIEAIVHRLVLSGRPPAKAYLSGDELDEAFLKERHEQQRDALEAKGLKRLPSVMKADAFQKDILTLSALLLLALNRRGGKEQLLEQADEAEQALLEGIRMLFAFAPIDLIDALLDAEMAEPHTLDARKLLAGVVDVDEPYRLLMQFSYQCDGAEVKLSALEQAVAADADAARRAAEIARPGLTKGLLLYLLEKTGHEVPELERQLQQLAVGQYGRSSGTRKLKAYLNGELTLDELKAAEPDRVYSGWGMFEGERESDVRLFGLLDRREPLVERFFIVFSGTDTRNRMLPLLRFPLFDIADLFGRYGRSPGVDKETLLLHALELSGYWATAADKDGSYEALISSEMDACLALFKKGSAELRQDILRVLFAAGRDCDAQQRARGVNLGLTDSSKAVVALAQEQLIQMKDPAFYVSLYRKAKKGKVKDMVLDAVGQLENAEAVYRELLEQEDTDSYRQLLEQLLVTLNATPAEAHAALGKAVDGKKLARLEWLEQRRLPELIDQQGKALPPETQRYVLSQSMEYVGVNPIVDQMRSYADMRSLSRFALAVLEQWLEQQAPAKEKWVLFLAAPLGGPDLVERLAAKVREWTDSARGAIAAEAIKAMAYSGELVALREIDRLQRTIKNRQVKQAAIDALTLAAEQMNISTEELEDRLVPTLGFDPDGKRLFSYGVREFEVRVNNELELVIVQRDTGKTLKSLPAPGAQDDAELAAEAKSEMTRLKKELKQLISVQSMRLESSLSKQRLWSVDAWRSLFVDNKLMQKFAIGLIWGVYRDGQLQEQFRYMDDGTFNTVDEEEYELAADSRIGLIHPLELDADTLDAWSGQLEDYEIVQPFPQLKRQVYRMSPELAKERVFKDLPQDKLSPSAFTRQMERLGWYKGEALDGGWFAQFFKDYDGLLAELVFSGTSIVYYEGLDPVELEGIAFYPEGERPYHYGNKKGLKLEDIPLRVFSETVYDAMRAAGQA